jgi:hypothetical protein
MSLLVCKEVKYWPCWHQVTLNQATDYHGMVAETAWRMKISWRGSFVLSSTGVKLTLVGSPFNTHSDSLMESDWPLWSEHYARRSGNTAAYLTSLPPSGASHACHLLRVYSVNYSNNRTLLSCIITIPVKLLCKRCWSRTSLYVYTLLVKVNVKVKVTLRPTISRPVRHGVRRPSGTRDQFFFLLEIFF